MLVGGGLGDGAGDAVVSEVVDALAAEKFGFEFDIADERRRATAAPRRLRQQWYPRRPALLRAVRRRLPTLHP